MLRHATAVMTLQPLICYMIWPSNCNAHWTYVEIHVDALLDGFKDNPDNPQKGQMTRDVIGPFLGS